MIKRQALFCRESKEIEIKFKKREISEEASKKSCKGIRERGREREREREKLRLRMSRWYVLIIPSPQMILQVTLGDSKGRDDVFIPEHRCKRMRECVYTLTSQSADCS